MSGSPPPLESLRFHSIRETSGLPPLTAVLTTTATPTRRRRNAPVVTVSSPPEFISIQMPMPSLSVPQVTEITEITTTAEQNSLARMFIDSNPEALTLSDIPLITVIQEDFERVTRNAAVDTSSIQGDVLSVATPVPAVTVGSSRSPEVLSISQPRGATPEQVVELSRSSIIQAPPLSETDRSFVIPLGGSIPQYPAGLPISQVSVSRKKPVPTSEVLSKKKGYYIVPWAGLFYYFKIPEVTVRSEHLFEFKVKPTTRREGFVVVGKEMYYVTLDDLKRGIVRKARKINVKSSSTYADLLTPTPVAGNAPATTGGINPSPEASPKLKSAAEIRFADGYPDNGPIIEAIGVDLCKEANLAFEIQSRALQDLISEEAGEDWEFSETA